MPTLAVCDWACRHNASFYGQGAQTDEPEDHFLLTRYFSDDGSVDGTRGARPLYRRSLHPASMTAAGC